MEAPAAGASVIGVISLALQPADSAIKLDSFIDTIMYSNIKGAHKAVLSSAWRISTTLWRPASRGLTQSAALSMK